MEEIDFNRLNWHGRYLDYNNIRYFNFSASGFSFKARAKKIEATFVSDATSFEENNYSRIGIFVWEGYDDSIEFLPKKLSKSVILSKNETKVTIFEEKEDKNICVWVIKLSEAKYAKSGLKKLSIDGCIINSLGKQSSKERIEIIGDSITCGYGVEGKDSDLAFTTSKERSDLSYAFLLARKLKAEYSFVSWSGIGVSTHWTDTPLPDTALLMGNLYPYTDRGMCEILHIEPIVWNNERQSPTKIIINLGTNDSSYIKDKKDRKLLFSAFYKELLEMVHRINPTSKVYCTYGVMEQSLTEEIKETVSLFSKEFPDVLIKFIPLALQKEEDGIGQNGHPSPLTQEKVCETIYKEMIKG